MKWISGILTIGTFAALYILEKKRPLRKQKEIKEIETVRNLAIASLAGVAINLFEKPITNKLTKLVEEKNVGLLKIFRLPKFIETALAVILMDYTLYLWHVLTHKSPFLWRFHQVHHADLDLKASTAIRFHFGEMTISVLWRAGQILLIGVTSKSLQIWQTLLFMSVFFHHSNLKIPIEFENMISKFITTPRLHGIHHSEKKEEMDSNWSSGLTIWDYMHGTFRNDIPQEKINIGVEEFSNQDEVTFGKMLLVPFESKTS